MRFLLAVGDSAHRLAPAGRRAASPRPRWRPRRRATEPFYEGKIAVAKFFAHNMLPLLTAVREVVESVDGEIMRLDNDAF